MNCWQTLGVDPTDNKREIKRAYAKKLKACNPEQYPREFQQLREAYDLALEIATQSAATLADEPQRSGDNNSDKNYPSISGNYTSIDQQTGDYASADAIDLADQTNQKEEHSGDQIHEEFDLDVLIEESDTDDSIDERSGYQQDQYSSRQANKHSIIQQQQAQVSRAIDEILPLLQAGKTDAAIDFCNNLLARDYYQALDVREELEGQLIQAMVKQGQTNFQFCDYLALSFKWDIDLHREGQIVSPHFASQDYQNWFYYFIEPYIIHLMRSDVKRYIAKSKLFRDKERAQELLCCHETHIEFAFRIIPSNFAGGMTLFYLEFRFIAFFSYMLQCIELRSGILICSHVSQVKFVIRLSSSNFE